MGKVKLPIHDISKRDFNNDGFKKRYLDKRVLEQEDLNAIEGVFGLSDRSPNSNVGSLCCSEYHQHDYPCNWYNSPEAGIVDRLLLEIRRYQTICSKVGEVASSCLRDGG
ncbi:MAG: hypothetical protein AABW50_04075 [Nanoarchaeota archaeon]